MPCARIRRHLPSATPGWRTTCRTPNAARRQVFEQIVVADVDVIALEMLATGEWTGQGVKGPEAFNADPFLALLNEYGAPWALQDRSV